MGLKLSNNATSTLASSITDVATSLTVQTLDAGLFPSLSAGDWFPLTVIDGNGNSEIMLATARAGSVITVTRAQEGTTAKAFPAGARVDLRMTAVAMLGTAQAQIVGAVEKTTPADDDTLGLLDSAANFVMKKLTWANLKTALQTVFDSRYLSLTAASSLQSQIDEKAAASHTHSIGNVTGLDGALAGKLSTSGKAADSNKLDNLDSSQFVRSDTSDTMSGNYTVTGNLSAQGNFYVGKSGGGDSWTYHFDDNTETWRSFGWDDSQNCFVAEENDGGIHKVGLVDTQTSNSATNFPIGHTILVDCNPIRPARNSSVAIYLADGGSSDYTCAGSAWGKGSQLSGTWRARGGHKNGATYITTFEKVQ